MKFNITGTIGLTNSDEWFTGDKVYLDAVEGADVPSKIKKLLDNPDINVWVDPRKYDVEILITGVAISQLQIVIDRLNSSSGFSIRISEITYSSDWIG
jgi:hypothetical protein